MADYRLRLFRRYPEKLMRQVVIYLQPTGSGRVHQTFFAIPGMRHEFEVIRLWEVPATELLAYPGLLPLAILGQTSDKNQTLQEIAQQIELMPGQTARNNVVAATSILAGLVLEKAIIQQILREDVVKESVIYQDILQEGLQQGLQQGRQEGELALVVRLLQRQVGSLDELLEAQIRSLPIEQLEALGEALLAFTQPDDLSHWLHQNVEVTYPKNSL